MAFVLAWPPRLAVGYWPGDVPKAVLASARELSIDADRASKSFPRAARLTESKQYRQVFSAAKRQGDRYFTILSVPNDQGHARIGMAVSRRVLPRAVDRHRVKRLIRESFRQQRADLTATDIVVLVKAPVQQASNLDLLEALARHWQRLRQV